MREGPAVDRSGKLAAGDAAVEHNMTTAVISYNAAISACEQGMHWIAAVSLLREKQQWNMEPNVITYNATICTCEKDQQ